MGSSQSKITSTTPFSISENTNTDLNRLTYITGRILGSSDLYDIENLAKPGTCGNYSIFLRKGIEQTLLPFIVDTSEDGKTKQIQEVFYQDPRKAIPELGKRKKVCVELIQTMLTAIATVTACLASIQVIKSRSRSAIVVASEKQKGGSVDSIRRWLLQAGYISSSQVVRTPIDFVTPGQRYLTPKVRFTLTFGTSVGNLTHGLIHAINVGSSNEYPTGSLIVYFLPPYPIPGTQTTIVPIQIVDKPGMVWMSGVLIGDSFKSFVDRTPPEYITSILERLFLSAGGGGRGGLQETREELHQASDIFNKLDKTGNANPMFKALNRFLLESDIGYQPASLYGQPVYQQPIYPQTGYPPTTGYPQPVYSQPAYPQAGYPQTGYPQTGYPQTGYLQTGYLQTGYPRSGYQQQGNDGQYDLPLNAVQYILGRIKAFRTAIASQSSPAEERAAALIGAGFDENRNIRTNVCNDPYWKKGNLGEIHPWATLQFLAINDWKDAGNRNVKLNKRWEEFKDELKKIYGEKINMIAPQIEQWRFNVNDLSVCKNNTAKQAPVFAAINALQNLYVPHVTQTWNIINSLIMIIKHPESGKDIIRFHPNVIRSGKSSYKYVREIADKALSLITKHYLEVENVYYKAAQSL